MKDQSHLGAVLEKQRREAELVRRAAEQALPIERRLSKDKAIRAALIEAWSLYAVQGHCDWSSYLATVFDYPSDTEVHEAIERARAILDGAR